MPVPRALPSDAEAGVAYLQFLVEDSVTMLMRSLVAFSFVANDARRRTFRPSQSISVLNRRRRAARLWINAILAGDISHGTLHSLTHSWLPQLAGTGPEPVHAARTARSLIEFVRGAITACIFDEPEDNLMRQARALHALETVLGVHLAAIRGVVKTLQR